MSILTLLVLLAVLATIASLTLGITSMAHDGEVAHRNSAQWMVARVTFQAAAFLLILLALFV
ncbi:MAG: twin transmembrane helix small protein [Betaproteobacteria bacterium]|nr:twin transmembrane helix small protein [Betaproteobacteria bacterium]MBI3936043.1 twin transmembrane helix small protein [Betaproteobacteria bacterium]